MQIVVTLTSGIRLDISEVSIFSDYPVGILEHIESYKAVLAGTDTEIDYDALTQQQSHQIESAIWNEYYAIERELEEKYGRNRDFEELIWE